MGSFERTRAERREVADASLVATSAVWRIVVGIVVLVAVIGVGSWWFKVATSDIKGAGDATRITNDGRNRVNAQEWFVGQYEQIRSTDRRLDEAAADMARKPGDEFAATNYRGLVNRCLEMVGNYNAEALKVSRAQWRDVSLPTRIDDTDPTTDCKPAATAPAR